MDCEMIMCQPQSAIIDEPNKTVVGLQMAILLVILHGGQVLLVENVMEDAEVLV